MVDYRNRLVKVNVHIAIAGLSLAFGTTAAGFFGMNLVSGFEGKIQPIIPEIMLFRFLPFPPVKPPLWHSIMCSLRLRCSGWLLP